MDNRTSDTTGYVYVLGVKDIQLPVCKIGMTTRNPEKRCGEINNSSTGDFLWTVVYGIQVNDCRLLESLVHAKMAPLRLKGREIFGLSPAAARITIDSIIDSQSHVVRIEAESKKSQHDLEELSLPLKKPDHFREIDSRYADMLQLFTSLLQVKGRAFGQLNQSRFGISDGNQGLQWNMSITPELEEVRLGVNLEGSEKTGKWLICPFILSKPDINEIKIKLVDQEAIYVCFTRDAWQGAARLEIVEKYLGGREFSIAELDFTRWNELLLEAQACLDEHRDYRKRKPDQLVTLKSDGRKLKKDVSPHLTIWTNVNMDGDFEKNLKSRFASMQPIYEWVKRSCRETTTS